MRDMIRMVATLTILAAVAGGLLSVVKISTAERIEQAVLEFVQGPAILSIMENITNDPLEDRFALEIEGEMQNFFVGKIDGVPRLIAFESRASGYGGELGVMVGVDVETDRIHGIGITTHSETPGVGSRAETDVRFQRSFVGIPVTDEERIMVGDGGDIANIGGATITARGVATAVRRAGSLYQEHKSQIKTKVETFSG